MASKTTMALMLSAVRSNAWSALPPPAELRVAVLGAGISGSVAARRLAGAGAKVRLHHLRTASGSAHASTTSSTQVTVFEAGRGPGGRMSTRRAELPDGTNVSVSRRSKSTSPRLTSPHLAAPRRASPRLASPHLASPGPHHLAPHRTTSPRATLRPSPRTQTPHLAPHHPHLALRRH